MACEAVNYWTFPELVAAFLDLLIAHCLLCASGFSFLASKFLGLFGLCLPCPCDGHYWNPTTGNHCLQRHLIDCPFERLSSVRSSAMARLPSLGENVVKWDRPEAECGATSGSPGPGELGLEGSEEECGVEGKRAVGRRVMRRGLRRRRLRGGAVGCGKVSSVSSLDAFSAGARNVPRSPTGVCKNGNGGWDDRDGSGGDREGPVDFGFFENASLSLELDDPNDDNKHFDRGEVLVEGDSVVDTNKKNNTFRVLEQALEEEHAARSALYVELEKERNAAASAADEAMAMILRLQEEKASIEMEARQYQRMIEAKAAYDAEEMNILKEILLRREREKHFLEKEVEAYRQMVLGNDQSDSDVQDVADGPVRNSSLYLSDGPILTLQQINDSIEIPRMKVLDGSSECEVSSTKSLNRTLAFGKELAIPVLAEDDMPLKQEDVYEHNSGNEPNREFREKSEISHGENVKSIAPFSDDLDQTGSFRICIDLASKESDIPYQENKDSHNAVLDEESSVYDVHVVDDECKTLNESIIEKNQWQSVSSTSNVPRRIGSSSTSALPKYDVSRSCSDILSGLPPTGCSREKARVTDFRRNSMSVVDYERVKIDNEVEWLTERLRIVQKGREKLNFTVGHKDREKLQLKLLEDIANQLREIRQLNEPGKAELQVTLPPSYAKVTSKKRHWRSASLNIHRSS